MLDLELQLLPEAPPPPDPIAVVGMVAALPHEEFEAALAQLPPDLQQLAQEMHDTIREERSRMLADLVQRLEREKLAPIIRAKRPIEERWAEDDRQYYGLDRQAPKADRIGAPDTSKEAIPPGLNLTASRTNTWVARIVNMTCPGSLLPGSISPTPSPESNTPHPTAEEGGDTTYDQMMQLAASRMNRTIKDQFAECKLPKHLRKAASDLGRYGVGIISGPHQTRPKRTKFRPVQGDGFRVYETYTEEKVKPSWRRVNPRYFFPEMVPDIADAGYSFELALMSRRELADLSKQPGFEQFADQFEILLDKDYKFELKGEIATNLVHWNNTSPAKDAIDARIAVWRFFGHLDLKDMEACGCDMPEGAGPPLMEIWFADGKILRADTMVPDGVTRLPYYVTQLFEVDDTMFGGGIPYAAREGQTSINALWRAAQHNASVSAGPQIGYQQGLAEPTDGDYRVRGPKTWRMTAEGKEIKDVLSSILIPSHAEQYLKLLEIRIQLLDEEINLPLIAQGQPDTATPTSSGLTMQMRAASVAILNIGQNCEDGWITPIFESAYHYNMLHGDDDSAKGDFDCISTLVSDNAMREIKAQNLLVLANMKKEDPQIEMRVKPEVFYPRLAIALEQDAELFRTEAETKKAMEEQQKNQPPDPKVLEIQLLQQKFQAETEFRQMDRQLDHQEKMRELDIREREAQSREYVANQQIQLKLMELAAAHEKSVQQIEAQLGIAGQRQQTEQFKAQMNDTAKQREAGIKARVEAEKLAQRDAENQLEIQVEKPGARLA